MIIRKNRGKSRGKAKASKSRTSKHHRRPTHISTQTFVPFASSPELSPATTPSPWTSHVTPPPSIRGVEESLSNSQPSHLEGGPTPGSSESVAASKTQSNVVASETQSNVGKPILYLDGQGFLPSHLAANGIGDIIKSHYTDPWPSWKKIPVKTRDLWFEKFMKKFSFCPPDDRWARKNFEMRGATILKNNLNKARSTMNKPKWLGESVWDRLCNHWGTQEFKKKSTQAKTNRASNCGGLGGSLHTGGSITTSQHRANMMKLTGNPPNPLDLFRRTHQHRKNNTWVDRRSEHVNKKFTRTWKELTQAASAQGTPPPSELDVWRDVAGIKKGRIYGLGMESTVVVGRHYYHGSCSSSTKWVRRQEFDELKNQMEEVKTETDELREIMENTNKAVEQNNRMIKQLMKSMYFRPMPSREETDDEDSDSEGQSESE